MDAKQALADLDALVNAQQAVARDVKPVAETLAELSAEEVAEKQLWQKPMSDKKRYELYLSYKNSIHTTLAQRDWMKSYEGTPDFWGMGLLANG